MTIQEYLEKLQPNQVSEYRRIQGLVHGTIANAEETISYGIPAFTYRGKYLLYYGAFKNHMSVFPGAHLIDQLKAKLDGFKVSKGTIQYTDNHLISESVLKELILLRKKQIDVL